MKKAIIAFAALILVIVTLSSIFVLRADKLAIVTRFGKITRVAKDPGLYFKTPFVEELTFYTRKVVEYDAAPVMVVTADKKNIEFDSVAAFRITDPELLFTRARTIEAVQQRLDDSVYAAVRIIAGREMFDDLLYVKRKYALDEAVRLANLQAKEYGVQVHAIYFKKVSLPKENEDAVYRSMIAERSRIAAQLRAEGKSEAVQIRSEAQRKYTETIASAQRLAEETKGQGDSEAQKILEEAIGMNTELYTFMRTMDFYRQTMKEGTPIIIKTNGFLEWFGGWDSISPSSDIK